MALFNDGPISGITDLMNYETSLLDVAATEGIDTSTKLQLAQGEIATELLDFLLARNGGSGALWCTPRRRAKGVGDVVVTDPLRRWHTLKTLAMVFRDAYDNQLNDRYKGKWSTYDQLQQHAARQYLQTGVGLVLNPAPKPSAPALTTTTGTAQPGIYYFGISWVTTTGEEGLCSEATAVTLTEISQAIVQCGSAPDSVAGWNVYAGTEATALALQNPTPVDLTSAWTQSMPLVAGSAPGSGQSPDWWVVNDHRLRRG